METFEAIKKTESKQNAANSFFGATKNGLPFIQPKLTINQPNDVYEQEADAMADKVMRMEQPGVQLKPLPITGLQRKCAHCEEEEKVQRKETNEAETTADNTLENYTGSLSGSGQPLPNEVRSFYEPRFGYDFSNVKVHTDTVAAKSAQSVNALAYTSGNNIVFNNDQFSPKTDSGKRLLGHELTHVVQQGAAMDNQQSASHLHPKLINHSTSGKIQRQSNLTATRFSGNRILESVFDGTAVVSKRSNNAGTHARLIQQSLIALGYTLPVFGVDGDFGNETETAVKQFQTDTGAVLIDGIVGVETIRRLNMQDTGGTTVTAVAGPAPVAATGAVFSEEPAEAFTGYDNSVAPNWLIVPVNGRRHSRVTVAPAGAVPTYISNSPAIATVQRTDTGIAVTGVSHGTANITAREGATVLGTLRVTVKNQINRSISFHYVCDSRAAAAGGPHCSNLTPAADDMRSLINRVWHLQANIRFTDGGNVNLRVPGDLGPTVDSNGSGGGEMGTVTALGTAAGVRLFRVGALTSPACGACNGGLTNGVNILIADAACADGLGIPHEVGHALGLNHPSGFIMTPCGGRVDRRVSKVMVDTVNP